MLHGPKIPDDNTLKATARWRLDLFYDVWTESPLDCYNKFTNKLQRGGLLVPGYTPFRNSIRKEWLLAKTRAIVDHDRLMMLDGGGSIARKINPNRQYRP